MHSFSRTLLGRLQRARLRRRERTVSALRRGSASGAVRACRSRGSTLRRVSDGRDRDAFQSSRWCPRCSCNMVSQCLTTKLPCAPR